MDTSNEETQGTGEREVLGVFTRHHGEGLCASVGGRGGWREGNRDAQGPGPGSGDGTLPFRPQSITSGFLCPTVKRCLEPGEPGSAGREPGFRAGRLQHSSRQPQPSQETGRATCQAQGCHLPELGVQGDSRGYWAPWQRPSRGQPRTSVSGLLCTVPGPGPTGTSADPTLFSGLLGALWTVGQSRESRCPEWVSQAGVGRVVGVCREACSQSSCPTIPQDPPHKPALGLSVETTR